MVLEKNKAQNHINKQRAKILKKIETYETRTKANTTKWRPIYEVIYEAYIKGSKLFPDDFMKECKEFNRSTGYTTRGKK